MCKTDPQLASLYREEFCGVNPGDIVLEHHLPRIAFEKRLCIRFGNCTHNHHVYRGELPRTCRDSCAGLRSIVTTVLGEGEMETIICGTLCLASLVYDH